MSYKDEIDIIIKSIALIGGAISIIIALFSYRQQIKQKQMDLFLTIWNNYVSNLKFQIIFDYLDNQESKSEFDKLSYHDKLEFLGFNEQIALMVEHGYINEQIAFDFFGYYAILCFDSVGFKIFGFENLPWHRYKKFVDKMKKIQEQKMNKQFYSL